MTDPNSIVIGLQAIKTATDIAKGILAADTGLERAELKLKIADLMESLADARVQLLDANEELRTLKMQMMHFHAVSKGAASPIRRHNVYYFANGDAEDGPFCPRCFENSKMRMPVTPLADAFRDAGRFECPECRSFY
jgi:hypothetical protein